MENISLADNDNYFKYFSLEESFLIDLNKLEENYQQLLIKYHPDKFANQATAEQKNAVIVGANINNGYTILKNPVSRANYLLELWGYGKALENRYINPQFIDEQIKWRDKIIDCDDDEKINEYIANIETNISDLINKLSEEFSQLRTIDVPPNKIAESIKHLQLWQNLLETAENKNL